MEKRRFDKKNVLLVEVDEADLEAFLVDTDLTDTGDFDWRLKDLADAIVETIPEYVFADNIGDSVGLQTMVSRLREAAQSIYKIKEYQLMYQYCVKGDMTALKEIEEGSFKTRGEFGELLLHMLLRDFKGTIPLVSKVYFKDSPSVPAHGFDAVHISPNEKIMWLGESKLYGDARSGLKELIKDLENHFNHDYLNEQFVIIKKNLENNSISERDEWIERLESTPKLSDQLNMINIPMLCTYEDDIYTKFPDIGSSQAKDYYRLRVSELKEYFDTRNKHSLKPYLNVILFLLPIKDKQELLTELHTRLWNMQNI